MPNHSNKKVKKISGEKALKLTIDALAKTPEMELISKLLSIEMQRRKLMCRLSNKKVKRLFRLIYSKPLEVRSLEKGLDFLYWRKGGTEKVIHYTFKSFLYYGR